MSAEKPIRYLLEDWIEKDRVKRLKKRAARAKYAHVREHLLNLAEHPLKYHAIPARGIRM